MFKLLKGGDCYTPVKAGIKDILVVNGKIWRVEDHIPPDILPEMEIIDCSGCIICPGLIDQHVHIIGGGGEEGPESRIPEIMFSKVIEAGETTVVGTLGFDDLFRNISGLLAKAMALDSEGITTYIYTGSYSLPTDTLTGKVAKDIAYIDKIIGAGEIAISDYRSSYPNVDELKKLASEIRKGALLGKKAGIMHIHVGDGKDGLNPLTRLVEESDFPVSMFVPTHINRNKRLLLQGIDYVNKGGNIDLTAGETSQNGWSIPDALEILVNAGIDMGKVTLSSDGNGSIPSQDGGATQVGKLSQLIDDVRESVKRGGLSFETVIKTVTENVAKVLKIYPQKGAIKPGSDADILALDKNSLNITFLFAKGEVLIKAGSITKKGRFDK